MKNAIPSLDCRMRGKNILYVITKLELGGAQKHLLSLIRHLDRENNNIFLFTAKEGLLYAEALSINNLRIKRSQFLERPLHPLKDVLALCELVAFIKKNNIDMVHTHSSKAGILGRLAAWLAEVKVVVHTVHGWPFHDYQAFFVRRMYIFLERFVARFTDILVVVSCHDRDKGLASRIGTIEQYALIRYGIDYSEFTDTANAGIREKLGLTDKDLVVGMVACLKPQKAPQDFIKMASLINEAMPEVKFLLAGDGILRQEIECLISKFKLQKQITLLGWRNDIPCVLSAIDIFVLTSLWEGLPIAVLEAMASSKPIVATDTGGVKEVISNGQTGFVVRPNDMRTMAGIVIGLLQDGNLRRKLGRAAALSLQPDFYYGNMASQVENLYETLNVL